MGVKQMISRAGEKVGDKVARLSKLSPEQLKDVEDQRERYLTEMPDPKDTAATELTEKLLAANGVEVYNAYLPQIQQLYVPVAQTAEYDGKTFDEDHNIRYFRITKWVTDKKENSLEKLINVYEVLSNEECNIALVFHRGVKGTDVYLAVTNTRNANNNIDVKSYQKRLQGALRGNFPGTELAEEGIGRIPCLDNTLHYSVASATNIPTEKSEKFISQTIEKLLDGIVPKNRSEEYTLILLATPIQDVDARKLKLEEIYSGLAPYAGWQTSFTFNESSSFGSSATVGVNVGASAGVQNGQNQATTNSEGETDSEAKADSDQISASETNASSHSEANGQGESEMRAESETNSFTKSASVEHGEGGGGGVNLGIVNAEVNSSHSHSISKSKSVSQTASEAVTKSLNKTVSDATSKAVANTVGKTVSNTLGKAVTKTAAVTSGVFKATNLGVNFGANFARSSNVTATVGKNEGIIQNFTNYNIKHTLELLGEQMKRFEESSALGMWDFAAYVMSEDYDIANNVAHSYIALTEGAKSFMSRAAVNLWRGDVEESEAAGEICAYLRELRHPVFGLNPELQKQDPEFSVYPAIVTATTALTGKELAYSLNFPQKSVVGLPVLQCAEFGRNVVTYDDAEQDPEQLYIGHVFHMNHEERTEVTLSKRSLASHTFVTGSTGSGKSNTVYQILDEAAENGVKFLVVEPAKGEYKDVFGNDNDVEVYGTNPERSALLRLNPFAFPDGIHVFEHMDRLVEIFNVCWPMYAAMPAVLKSAVEQSYADCGWNLTDSTNPYGDGLYPTFADVARNIRTIIDSSEYDAENKGAYKGSLLTRLQSLTNGINGMIFTSDAISDTDLFDRNVIVDLSRVGSSETKSLIMGVLVLKLQEHRMTEKHIMDGELRHITVLEEAHNLLKRTSTEQPAEGGNLLGKSVEMIANAIAEMRTYGEGFIIVDQAPGLLDMAAIRNTNTKMIMRLPDQQDRELVGRAANLNEDQITELAKLPCGVAAVYQNEWVQPVLCKIYRFDVGENTYQYFPSYPDKTKPSPRDALKIAELLSQGTVVDTETVLKEIRPKLIDMKIPASIQVMVMKLLHNPPSEPRIDRFAPIMAALFPEAEENLAKVYSETPDQTAWTEAVRITVKKMGAAEVSEQVRRDIIQAIVTDYIGLKLNDISSLREWKEKGGF